MTDRDNFPQFEALRLVQAWENFPSNIITMINMGARVMMLMM